MLSYIDATYVVSLDAIVLVYDSAFGSSGCTLGRSRLGLGVRTAVFISGSYGDKARYAFASSILRGVLLSILI